MILVKTKYILFILALGFYFSAQCQFIYTRQDASNNWFSSACQEKGTTNLLLAASNFSYIGTANLYYKSRILKLSSSGNLIDSVSIDSNYFIPGPIHSLGSYYYLLAVQIKNYGAGNSAQFPVVLKYDLNFNLVNRMVLDSFYNKDLKNTKVISKQGRLFLGYASANPYRYKLFKLDLNLVKLDSTSDVGLINDIENYGNKILLSGLGFPQSSIYGSVQVAELDTGLNVLSRFNLDSLLFINNPPCPMQWVGMESYTGNLFELDSNRYFITGWNGVVNSSCNVKEKTISSIIKNNSVVQQTHIIGIDSLDNLYWPTTATTSSKRGNFIYSTAIAGYDLNNPYPPQQNDTYILVHKIDTAGNLIWTNYYGGDKYYLPLGIYATPDSGAIVCGMRYDHIIPQVTNACEGFVLKLNKNGNMVFTGIEQNGKLNTHYHKCFPNPSLGKLQFDLPFQEDVEIRIEDVSCKEVLKATNYKNLSALNISELGSGVYLYKIKTKTSFYSGKFVKE